MPGAADHDVSLFAAQEEPWWRGRDEGTRALVPLPTSCVTLCCTWEMDIQKHLPLGASSSGGLDEKDLPTGNADSYYDHAYWDSLCEIGA